MLSTKKNARFSASLYVLSDPIISLSLSLSLCLSLSLSLSLSLMARTHKMKKTAITTLNYLTRNQRRFSISGVSKNSRILKLLVPYEYETQNCFNWTRATLVKIYTI